MNPIAEIVTVGGRKWLDGIHISKHIWLPNRKALKHYQNWKKMEMVK